MTDMIVRTRFAPSPSGHLHVGGARTALYCWAFAKQRGGKFVLRIEDTDQKRSSDASSMAFLEDLKWLGILWDEGPVYDGCGGGDAGPYFQSQRLAIYNQHIDGLIETGLAYRAFETPEELDAAREKAKAEKKSYRYDRAALNLPPETIRQYLDEGRPHVVRFKVPDDKPVTFHDEIRGDVSVSAAEIDDFVIRKADGYPTYHFAVVVDDELMGVTHVIRAQEHLSNTPRHILLQEAMRFRRPVYAHLSIVMNPDGSKMSKRDKDRALRAAVRGASLNAPPPGLALREEEWAWWLDADDRQLPMESARMLADALHVHLPEIDVDDFRCAGYLPEVLVNYLALLGWSPGGDIEKFDRDFLIERFGLDRVINAPARFDRDKLLAFNLDALQAMTADEFAARLREHGEQFHPEFMAALGEQFDAFARANQSRSKTLDDPFRSDRFFVLKDEEIVYEDSKPVRKALAGQGFDHLDAVRKTLASIHDWTVASLEEAISGYANAHAEGKLGKVAQPLRIAVTGGTVSPAIFDTLAILGKDRTLRRIDRCLSQRETVEKA